MVQVVENLPILGEVKAPFIFTDLPGKDGRHFADNIFRRIFVNEMFWILIKIWLKIIRNGPIDIDPALIW